jgi:riboflavin biosynthesis pyrimidine reductase
MVRRAHHDSEFQPQRIILDPSLRIPPEAKVVQSGTTIVTAQSDVSGDLSKRGVHVASVPLSGGSFDWPRLWEALPGVTSILVEGGPETWRRFKEAGMMDEEVILTQ